MEAVVAGHELEEGFGVRPQLQRRAGMQPAGQSEAGTRSRGVAACDGAQRSSCWRASSGHRQMVQSPSG